MIIENKKYQYQDFCDNLDDDLHDLFPDFVFLVTEAPSTEKGWKADLWGPQRVEVTARLNTPPGTDFGPGAATVFDLAPYYLESEEISLHSVANVIGQRLVEEIRQKQTTGKVK